MPDAHPQRDTLDETLVAYLDGELPAGESESIESLLASDPETRERLQSLDRVWNALDSLPRASTDPSFTNTTIAMVASQANEPKTSTLSGRSPVALATLVLAGVVLGFVLMRGAATSNQRRLLEALPVVIHASALEQADSVDYLRLLSEALPPGAWSDAAAEWDRLHGASRRERREWVQGLDEQRRGEVGEGFARFVALPPAQREALTRLDNRIASQADASRLRQTALSYNALVESLPSSQRARLRETPVDQRLREVRRRSDEWESRLALQLEPDESRRFIEALERLIESPSVARRVELISQASDPRAGRLASQLIDHPERLIALASRVAALPDLSRLRERGGRDRGGRDRPRPPFGESQQRFIEGLRSAWDEEWRPALIEALPERTAEQLRSTENPRRRAEQWTGLFMQASPRDAGQYVADLENDQLERLLAMPTSDMQSELRRLMAEDTLGWEGLPRGGRLPGWPRRPEGPPGGRGGFGPPRQFDRDGPPPRRRD